MDKPEKVYMAVQRVIPYPPRPEEPPKLNPVDTWYTLGHMEASLLPADFAIYIGTDLDEDGFPRTLKLDHKRIPDDTTKQGFRKVKKFR